MTATHTDGGGMLDSAVRSVLTVAGFRVVATGIQPGWAHSDVFDRDQVGATADSTAPDLIVHLAAETSLERARQLNTLHAVDYMDRKTSLGAPI